MKILYSWGHHGFAKYKTERMIERYIQAGYDITLINHREELGEDKTYTTKELYKLYRKKDSRLMQLYEKVARLSKTHDIFIVKYDNVYLPEFLKSLNDIYKVYFCDDDPEGSNVRSKPYVYAFDYCFAAAVNFDKNTKTWKKYLEWGAKRADWYPLGVMPEDYDPTLSVEDIYDKHRDIDVIYVGPPERPKLSRLLELKKQTNITLYGNRWGIYTSNRLNSLGCLMKYIPQHFFSSRVSRRLFKIQNTYLPDDELIPSYQRTKIGINLHLSYGPINLRLYQLPANGVMQICDCPEGLGEVFEIGKEVVVYHSIEEAVELIKYYLEHDDERKKIAAAGFKRVMKDYKDLTIFNKVIEKIKKGMVEDGIKHFKSGESIRV